MNRRLIVLVLVLATVSGGFLAGVSADSEYEITFPDDDEHVDVPEQSVTFEGESYSISAIGMVDPDGSFDVVVETDSDETFNVNLRNSERDVVEARSRVTADETLTFDADGLAPGTYTLQVEDGLTQALGPVVVQAYDVSSPEPDHEGATVEPGDDVTVTTTLTDLEPRPISEVELVVWNGDSHDRLSMAEAGDHSYEKTVSDLEEGSYEMYVIVYGEDEIQDRDQKEMIAVSQPTSLAVQESDDDNGDDPGSGETTPTPTPTETPSEKATETPTSTETSDATTTETPTETPTSTETSTETPDANTTESPTEPATDTSTDEPAATDEPTTTDVPTATDDGPITPAPTDQEPTSGETALTGIPQFLIAVLVLGLAARLRSRFDS